MDQLTDSTKLEHFPHPVQGRLNDRVFSYYERRSNGRVVANKGFCQLFRYQWGTPPDNWFARQTDVGTGRGAFILSRSAIPDEVLRSVNVSQEVFSESKKGASLIDDLIHGIYLTSNKAVGLVSGANLNLIVDESEQCLGLKSLVDRTSQIPMQNRVLFLGVPVLLGAEPSLLEQLLDLGWLAVSCSPKVEFGEAGTRHRRGLFLVAGLDDSGAIDSFWENSHAFRWAVPGATVETEKLERNLAGHYELTPTGRSNRLVPGLFFFSLLILERDREEILAVDSGSKKSKALDNQHSRFRPVVQSQDFSPLWSDANSFLGVYVGGEDCKIQLRAESRTQAALTFELLEGNLPEGLTWSDEGSIGGIPIVEMSDIAYCTLKVVARDVNGSTERTIFFAVVNRSLKNQLQNFDFESSLASKSTCYDANGCIFCTTICDTHLSYACCMAAESRVLFPSGVTLPISSVPVGSKVMGAEGECTVLERIEVSSSGRKVFEINSRLRLTSDHIIMCLEGPCSVDPLETKKTLGKKVDTLTVGKTLLTTEGPMPVASIVAVKPDTNQKLYNLIVSGPNVYFCDGVLVSGEIDRKFGIQSLKVSSI